VVVGKILAGEILMDKLDLKEFVKICALRGWTVGTAESCTGGLLAALFVSEPGVSSFFRGSVVSYAKEVKIDVLGVPKPLIDVTGEVSTSVALEMARGVRRVLQCDWAVGITGIAGPSGGSKEKPVGTVCISAVGPGIESVIEKRFESKLAAADIRKDIQRQSALFAFDFLLTAMR
jgi:PncC family amidohydrolase